jgi:hypothetical protein
MNVMDNLIFLFPFSWPFYLSNRTLNWIQKKKSNCENERNTSFRIPFNLKSGSGIEYPVEG